MRIFAELKSKRFRYVNNLVAGEKVTNALAIELITFVPEMDLWRRELLARMRETRKKFVFENT